MVVSYKFLLTLPGEICEKTKAQDLYSDKIAEGNGAYLLEENNSVFMTLYVGISCSFRLCIHFLPGNLPPQQGVIVLIKFVSEVKVEGTF